MIKKRPFKILFAVLLLNMVWVSSAQAQQKEKKVKTWKVVMKSKMRALPGASAKVRKQARDYNVKRDSMSVKKWATDEFVKIIFDVGAKLGQLYDIKDSTLTSFRFQDKSGYKIDYPINDIKQDMITRIRNFENFPDSSLKIQGFRCHKASYEIHNSDTAFQTIEVWYDSKLPYAPFSKNQKVQIPGLILKTKIIQNHAAHISTAISVKKEKVPLSIFSVPDDFLIEDYSRHASSHGNYSSVGKQRPQKTFDTNARDSVLQVVNNRNRTPKFDRISVFKNGFAHVETPDSTYYINISGVHIFDKIIKKYHPIDNIKALRPGWVSYDRSDSVTMFIVEKNGKYGLWSNAAGEVLPLKYDHISIDFKRYLKLIKDGKIGYADTWGEIILPVQFTDANIMNDRYFDVQKGTFWGIYDNQNDTMVLPAEYDEFDYCGGCGGSVDYAYASKNGKWGVISFKDSILVPFEYEHPAHWGMRSDNWVTSFEKDSMEIVINMNTGHVYSGKEYQQMRIYNGALALKKNGKYALFGRNDKQLTDFEYNEVVDPYDNFHWGSLIKVYKNDKEGIIDNKGQVIFPLGKYKNIYLRNKNFIVKKAGKETVIDSTGKKLLPFQYEEVQKLSNHPLQNAKGKPEKVLWIRNNKKQGFVNQTTGDQLLPQYQSVEAVYNKDSTQNYIEVEDFSKRQGLYTLHGKKIMPPSYKSISFLSNRLVKTENKDYKEGIYDLKTQREIFPTKYDAVFVLGNRYVYAKNFGGDSLAEIYDLRKESPVDLPFKEIDLSGKEGLLIVSDTVNSYLFSLKKRKTISAPYKGYRTSYGLRRGIRSFSHGLARVTNGVQYGYIDVKGKPVVPVKYDQVEMSKKGIIKLSFKTKQKDVWQYQYADSTGKVLGGKSYTQNKGFGYIYPYRFQNGKYLVISHYSEKEGRNEIGVMTINGKIVVPPKYDKVTPFLNGNGFIVERDQKFGIYNKAGKQIMPTVLDNYYHYSGKYLSHRVDLQFPVLCVLKNHYFYLTAEGKILPFTAKGHMTSGLSEWGRR